MGDHDSSAWRARLLIVGVALALGTTSAWAQGPTVHTRKGPLARSLTTVSRQTGTNVLFAPSSVAGLSAPAIDGQMTAAQAIHTLLAATDLESVPDDNGGLIVRRRLRVAQSSPTPPRRSAAPSAVPFATPATDRLQTVIVTAEKRTENEQDVPISVSAISASSLAATGIAGSRNLSAAVPGVTFTQTTGAGNFYIRGIGNPNGTPGDQGATAFYVDGVYIPTLWGDIFDFNNIKRVEVLKGPQGTLFGRNAAAGVVQIVTRDPSHSPKADLAVGYGNYNTVDVSAYATTGLTDTLAADIAVIYHDQRSGYGRNYLTGRQINKERHFGLRSKWQWKPSEATTVTLAGDYFHRTGDFGEEYRVLPGEVGIDGKTTYQGFYNNYTDGLTNYTVSSGGGSLTVDHDFGRMSLTSISAYRTTEGDLYIDQDVTAAPLFNVTAKTTDRSYTEEARLTSDKGSWAQWLAGVFFMNDIAGYDPANPHGGFFGGTGFRLFSEQKTNSYAAFAQGSKDILPGTKLTLGIRYSVDDVSMQSQNFSAIPVFVRPLYNASEHYPSTTWRVALDHHFTKAVMGYVSYNRGFKSGLFNISVPNPAPPVRPETVDAYELGLKSRFFGNRLQVNVAGFYDRFRNAQLRQFGAAAGSYFLLNAASGRSDGVDIDVRAVLSDRLRVRAALEALDAKYTHFPNAPYTYPKPAVCTPNGPTPGYSTGPSSGGDLTCVGNASGNHMIGSPPVTATLSAQYRIPFRAGDLVVNGLFSHTATYYFEADNRLQQPAHDLLNASLDWMPSAGRWEVDVWGKNLTGTRYYFLVNSANFGDFAAPAAPLTFGAQFKVHLE